eukprot:763396-Hanusia_phi.AAC.3
MENWAVMRIQAGADGSEGRKDDATSEDSDSPVTGDEPQLNAPEQKYAESNFESTTQGEELLPEHDSTTVLMAAYCNTISQGLADMERQAKVKFRGNDSEWKQLVGPIPQFEDLKKKSSEEEEKRSSSESEELEQSDDPPSEFSETSSLDKYLPQNYIPCADHGHGAHVLLSSGGQAPKVCRLSAGAMPPCDEGAGDIDEAERLLSLGAEVLDVRMGSGGLDVLEQVNVDFWFSEKGENETSASELEIYWKNTLEEEWGRWELEG